MLSVNPSDANRNVLCVTFYEYCESCLAVSCRRGRRWKVEGMWKVVRLLFIGMYHMID